MHRLSQFLPCVWGQGACLTPLKRSIIFVCFQESDCFTAVENNSCLGNSHGSFWKQCGADKYTQLEIRIGVSDCHHCRGPLSRAADAKCCLACRGISSSQIVSGSCVYGCCEKEWGFSTWTNTHSLYGKVVPGQCVHSEVVLSVRTGVL